MTHDAWGVGSASNPPRAEIRRRNPHRDGVSPGHERLVVQQVLKSVNVGLGLQVYPHDARVANRSGICYWLPLPWGCDAVVIYPLEAQALVTKIALDCCHEVFRVVAGVAHRGDLGYEPFLPSLDG